MMIKWPKTALSESLQLQKPLIQAPVKPGKFAVDHLVAFQQKGGLPCLGARGLEKDQIKAIVKDIQGPYAIHDGEQYIIQPTQQIIVCEKAPQTNEFAVYVNWRSVLEEYPGQIIVAMAIPEFAISHTLLIKGAAAIQVGLPYLVGDKPLPSKPKRASSWDLFTQTSIRA